jgi:hypothetical protein
VVDARKMWANGEGVETEIPVHDLIELGVVKGKKDSEEPLHTEKVWITQPHTTFTFTVDEKPTRAAIDPYSKLIDRNPEESGTDVEYGSYVSRLRERQCLTRAGVPACVSSVQHPLIMEAVGARRTEFAVPLHPIRKRIEHARVTVGI